MDQTSLTDRERRKQVKIRLRPDLDIAPHKYEGRTYFIVKDPVSLRYFRFKEQEHFLLRLMDGAHTLDDTQKEFEKQYRPERLTLEDLEGFAQQLLKVGLAQNDSPQSGKQLYEHRQKRLRRERIATWTNILYIKLPLFDPDRLLTRMLPWCRWVFTTWFFILSVSFILSALWLVLTNFDTFRQKLPAFHEFFSLRTMLFVWISLGFVKVIHEFGHGLSCKAFGGEVHEMGFLMLCLSPALYCNVSDAWTLPNKWHRIIISFAGIYVELMIAAAATFIWWNSAANPFLHHLSLCLMVICSVSTVIFNGNPLMKFDGYYVLSDWLEIPNLRDRSNRFLKQTMLEHALGVEVQREQYMELWRRVLFVVYAVGSYVYRWVITFTILYFMYIWLRPYKLGTISAMLAGLALGSMIGWPLWNMGQAYHKRGRLPDMKPGRVGVTTSIVVVLLLLFFFLPLPVSRVRQTGVVQFQPGEVELVFVPHPGGILEELMARNGDTVREGQVLARLRNIQWENELAEARTKADVAENQIATLDRLAKSISDPVERLRVDREITRARGERELYAVQIRTLDRRIKSLELRSPRNGVVVGLPRLDEVGKTWEAEEDVPFCSIGDPTRLRVLLPLRPDDYRLVKQNIQALGGKDALAVTIRVQGRDSHTWAGRISLLPESEARDVPPSLADKHGGPLSVKPSANPNHFAPQSQHYLVGIDIINPDSAVCPGTMAQAKIHNRWRTCAWWLWHTISSTFDLGLL